MSKVSRSFKAPPASLTTVYGGNKSSNFMLLSVFTLGQELFEASENKVWMVSSVVSCCTCTFVFLFGGSSKAEVFRSSLWPCANGHSPPPCKTTPVQKKRTQGCLHQIWPLLKLVRAMSIWTGRAAMATSFLLLVELAHLSLTYLGTNPSIRSLESLRLSWHREARPNDRLCTLPKSLRCADTRTLCGPLGWKHAVATCAWNRAQIRRNSGRLTNSCPLQTQVGGSHFCLHVRMLLTSPLSSHARHSPLKGANGKIYVSLFPPFTSCTPFPFASPPRSTPSLFSPTQARFKSFFPSLSLSFPTS